MRSVHSKQINGGGHEQSAGIWTDEAYVAHVFGVPRAVYGWGRGDTCVTADYSAALVACVAPGAVVGGVPVHQFRRRQEDEAYTRRTAGAHRAKTISPVGPTILIGVIFERKPLSRRLLTGGHIFWLSTCARSCNHHCR